MAKRRRKKGNRARKPGAGGVEASARRPDRPAQVRPLRLVLLVTVLFVILGLGGLVGLRWIREQPQIGVAAGPVPADSASVGSEVPQIDNLVELDPAFSEAIREAVAEAKSTRSAGAFGRLGLLYQAHQYIDLARSCYKIAQALDSSAPTWPYYLAVLASERGQAEEAITLFEVSLERRPDYLPARYRLGESLLAADLLEEARESFERVEREAPEQPWGALGLGRLYRRQDRLEEAVAALERAVKGEPSSTQARYLLARTQIELGRGGDDGTLGELGGGLKAESPSDPWLDEIVRSRRDLETLNQIANQLLARGRIDEAEQTYQRILGYRPDHYDALYNLGVLYGRQERFQESLIVLDQAARSRPDNPAPHLLKAIAYSSLGQADAASNSVEAALRLDPENPQALQLRAQLR